MIEAISTTQRQNTTLLYSTFWKNRGPIHREQAIEHADHLNIITPQKIYFLGYTAQESVDSGVCSAHCLAFLSLFLRSFRNESLAQLCQRNPEPLFSSLEDRIIRCVNACPNDTEIRTCQAALDTIMVFGFYFDEEDESMEAKARAICALKGLHVTSSTPNNIDFHKKPDRENKKAFFETLDTMEEGTYFLRAIHANGSLKKEAYGHSMALIKTQDGCYFFDPCSSGGLVYINKNSENEYLYDIVKQVCLNFRLNYPRFYKVQAGDFAIMPMSEN